MFIFVSTILYQRLKLKKWWKSWIKIIILKPIRNEAHTSRTDHLTITQLLDLAHLVFQSNTSDTVSILTIISWKDGKVTLTVNSSFHWNQWFTWTWKQSQFPKCHILFRLNMGDSKIMYFYSTVPVIENNSFHQTQPSVQIPHISQRW
jgi:hypothetical protein